jgi:hypothetical protein
MQLTMQSVSSYNFSSTEQIKEFCRIRISHTDELYVYKTHMIKCHCYTRPEQYLCPDDCCFDSKT